MTDKEYAADCIEFLRGLAERLMKVPVMYGTDQGDVDKLHEIATSLQVDTQEDV